ncbi:hypothetical protein GCM10010391_72270 [Streptomyces anthocyanicus]|nr:hypothetical protein GCM10010391_72270 [Streptomyces anthocyanicus]
MSPVRRRAPTRHPARRGSRHAAPERFYQELVRTHAVINCKYLGLRTVFGAARILPRNLLPGQTAAHRR